MPRAALLSRGHASDGWLRLAALITQSPLRQSEQLYRRMELLAVHLTSSILERARYHRP